jgi:hypothetical protein
MPDGSLQKYFCRMKLFSDKCLKLLFIPFSLWVRPGSLTRRGGALKKRHRRTAIHYIFTGGRGSNSVLSGGRPAAGWAPCDWGPIHFVSRWIKTKMDHVPRIQKRARSDLYMCQCQRARSILTVKTNLMVQVGAESVVHIVAVALDILSLACALPVHPSVHPQYVASVRTELPRIKLWTSCLSVWKKYGIPWFSTHIRTCCSSFGTSDGMLLIFVSELTYENVVFLRKKRTRSYSRAPLAYNL